MKFTLVIDKGDGKTTEIKPWGGKAVEVQDWLRSISALTARNVRQELATFVEVKNDSVVVIDHDNQVLSKTVDLAVFSSEVGGEMYDVAAYLVPDSIKKPGNRVILGLLGCCSIISVKEAAQDRETIDE